MSAMSRPTVSLCFSPRRKLKPPLVRMLMSVASKERFEKRRWSLFRLPCSEVTTLMLPPVCMPLPLPPRTKSKGAVRLTLPVPLTMLPPPFRSIDCVPVSVTAELPAVVSAPVTNTLPPCAVIGPAMLMAPSVRPAVLLSDWKLTLSTPEVELTLAPVACKILFLAANVMLEVKFEVLENPESMLILPALASCPKAVRVSLRPAFNMDPISSVDICPKPPDNCETIILFA